MGFGKQTKGSDGSAQTIVGDRADHQRGRANDMRRYRPAASRGFRAMHEQDDRTEMNGGSRRAERN
jgi:hypothetical protein